MSGSRKPFAAVTALLVSLVLLIVGIMVAFAKGDSLGESVGNVTSVILIALGLSFGGLAWLFALRPSRRTEGTGASFSEERPASATEQNDSQLFSFGGRYR